MQAALPTQKTRPWAPRRPGWLDANRCRNLPVHITSAKLMPIATLVAGVFALIIPRCLSYVAVLRASTGTITSSNDIWGIDLSPRPR
jgi:hypothetical protein